MRTYYRNKDGYYYYPVYYFGSFWLAVAILVLIVSSLLVKFLNISFFADVRNLAFIISLILAVAELIKIIVGSMQNDGILKYFWSLYLADCIRKSLLNTMDINIVKNAPIIEVPAVEVEFSDDKIKVYVSKLAGMSDIDKVREDIDSSFRGKYKAYAVVEAIASINGVEFSFTLEDVGTDRTFIPKTINDLVKKPYFLTLQKGLTINLAKYPHMAVWGRTGSGKTTVLMNIIAQCFSNDTDLLFIDGKTEFSSFSIFYPSSKIVTDNADVLNLLKHVTATIMERQKIIADEVKRRKKLGLTGFDLGLKPIVVIGDEIGSIVAGMTAKEKKQFVAYLTQIVQKGRSVSVFLIVASQSPAVDVLPNGIRSQFSTKILLGSASGDIQRMAFDEVATDGGVDKFQGYYMVNGLTVQPQKFFVPNLFKYDLENMETFQALYDQKR